MVVLQDERVRRPKPRHGTNDEDDQGGPFLEERCKWQVLGASGTCNVDDASWKMRNEECGEDDGNPEIAEGHDVQVFLIRWEVLHQGRRPDLGAKVARHAHDGARKNQALCIGLAHGSQPRCKTVSYLLGR